MFGPTTAIRMLDTQNKPRTRIIAAAGTVIHRNDRFELVRVRGFYNVGCLATDGPPKGVQHQTQRTGMCSYVNSKNCALLIYLRPIIYVRLCYP